MIDRITSLTTRSIIDNKNTETLIQIKPKKNPNSNQDGGNADRHAHTDLQTCPSLIGRACGLAATPSGIACACGLAPSRVYPSQGAHLMRLPRLSNYPLTCPMARSSKDVAARCFGSSRVHWWPWAGDGAAIGAACCIFCSPPRYH